MKPSLEQIKKNLGSVRERIEKAAERAGRRPDEVRLMAATKTFPVEFVELACRAGIELFGENRVQEALEKYGQLDGELRDAIELHLIGHLQRNKAKKAAGAFRCVQSIDKVETALELQKHCRKLDRRMDILLEVNTSGEESKFGVAGRDELISLAEQLMSLDALNIRGLMTIGPFTDNKERIRRAFAELRRLYGELQEMYPELGLDILSMGMSADYELAIEEGSNLVRIGTALFGRRE